jgi:WD40 repeat protein
VEKASTRTPLDDLTGRELLAIIDIEIGRLPDRYRLPVILCGLEGMTRDEAAAQLGWTVGGVKGRLERARELLRRRLASRGLTLPVVLAGLIIAPTVVPLALRAATMRLVMCPSSVAMKTLANGVGRQLGSFSWSRLTIAVMAVGIAAALTLAGFGGPATPPTKPGPPAKAPAELVEQPVSILPADAIRTFGDQRFRHPGGISGSALSPDGKRLATAAYFSVIMWDTNSGNPLWKADAGTGGLWGDQPLFFSPDGTLLALVRTNYAMVWEAATGKLLKRVKDPRVKDEWSFSTFQHGACFTEDGKHLIIGRSAHTPTEPRLTTECYDVKTWEIARTMDGPSPTYVSQSLAIGLDKRRALMFSDPATGRIIVQPKDQMPALRPFLSPSRKRVAVCRDHGTIDVWSVPDGALVASFPQFAKNGRLVGVGLLTPDDKTLLVARSTGIVRLDLTTGKELEPIPQRYHPIGGQPSSLHLMPDNDTLLACADDGLVHRWSLATLKELPLPDGYINFSRAFASHDGRYLAISAADGRLDIWNLETAKRTLTINESAKKVTAVAFSSKNETLAVGRLYGEVQLADLSSGRIRAAFTIQSDRVDRRFANALIFSPDDRTLFVNIGHTQVEVIDVADGKRRWGVLGPEVFAVDPDGKQVVSGGIGPNLTVTDSATGAVRKRIKLSGTLNERMGSEVPALVYSPDGRRLFVSTRDQQIRILDAVTLDERASFVTSEMMPSGFGPMKSAAEALAVSADGQWLLTGGQDRTVRLWEIATRAEVRRFVGHDCQLAMVAFGPHGRSVVSCGERDGVVYQWDLRPREAGPIGPSTWGELGSSDPAAAYRALWSLASEPVKAVELLRTKLRPVVAPTPERFAMLIGQLGSDDFVEREKATKELSALGRAAGPELKAAITRGLPAEARERADKLLKVLEGEPMGEELRRSRAVQAIELAGGPEAIALLKEWATGAPPALLTERAQSAVGRLSKR